MGNVGRGRIQIAGLQPSQVLAGLVGVAFLAAGVVGFVKTGLHDFTSHGHVTLLWFAVNPLHNTVHAVIGVLGLLMAVRSAAARLFGWLLFVAYGAVFLWGLMVVGVISTNPLSGAGNPLDLTPADNWLHLGSAAVGVLIAVLPARRVVIIPDKTTDSEPVGHGRPAHESGAPSATPPSRDDGPEPATRRSPTDHRHTH